MSNLTVSTVIEHVRCGNCNIEFGLEASFHRDRKRDGKSFYCPNGHFIRYSDNELDLVKRQLADVTMSRDAARRDAQATRHALRAEKGHVTRLKRRAVAGVCACCHRSFANVARHMKTKHPEAVKAARKS